MTQVITVHPEADVSVPNSMAIHPRHFSLNHKFQPICGSGGKIIVYSSEMSLFIANPKYCSTIRKIIISVTICTRSKLSVNKL